MSRGRRRTPTPEETALWQRVARSAVPLPGRQDPGPEAAGPALAKRADPPIPKPRIRAKIAPPPRPGAAVTLDRSPDPYAALAEAPSQLDGRRAERLRRGKLEPEARLDLHGKDRAQAHAALVGFVLRAQAEGLRLVLVITGKGRTVGSDTLLHDRPGILRHTVPHWLAAPPLTGRVVEARPAHPRHGGGGALYLYLRRRRP